MVTDHTNSKGQGTPGAMRLGDTEEFPDGPVGALARRALLRISDRSHLVSATGQAPGAPELEYLAHLLLLPDPSKALDAVRDRYVDGESIRNLYLWHLGGAAQVLGRWWVENTASFFQVTTGLGRIFSILDVLRRSRANDNIEYEDELLFASVPGEDHVLGVRMATDLFRSEGWDVRMLMGPRMQDISRGLEDGKVGVVGLSASQPEFLGELSQLISGIRASHPGVRILVSGRVLDVAEEQVARLKPDWTVKDIPEGIELMSRQRVVDGLSALREQY